MSDTESTSETENLFEGDDTAELPGLSLKEELIEFVQSLTTKQVLSDVIAQFAEHKKLNRMVLDLYDYDKGFELLFREYGKEENNHGKYSYAVPIIEYIRDGQIPYEVFDRLYKYCGLPKPEKEEKPEIIREIEISGNTKEKSGNSGGLSKPEKAEKPEIIREIEISGNTKEKSENSGFQVFYGGFVVCELRLNFGLKGCFRSHYVLLRHSIQTIDAECLMKCKKNKSLNFEEERAKLIKSNSPDLCLDPNPAVAESIFFHELNHTPFLTPALKDIVLNEKARREMGVARNFIVKSASQKSASSNPRPKKQQNWSFRLSEPNEEEVELAQTGLNLEYSDSLKSYLKERPICFPDEKSFTGFHVEIENFEYEYKRYTKKKEVKSVIDKLCIAVLNDKEYYYGAYQLNLKMTEKRKEPCGWWDIGNRESLDIFVNAFTYEEMKLTCAGMKITHYRMFDEKTEYTDGNTMIIRQKLQVPVNQVVLELSPPSSEEETDEEMDQD